MFPIMILGSCAQENEHILIVSNCLLIILIKLQLDQLISIAYLHLRVKDDLSNLWLFIVLTGIPVLALADTSLIRSRKAGQCTEIKEW